MHRVNATDPGASLRGRHHRRSVCLVCPSLDVVAVLGTDARALDTAVDVTAGGAENANAWVARAPFAVEGL